MAMMTQRTRTALLGAITVLAACLRLRGISNGLRIDEIEIWRDAQYPLWHILKVIIFPHVYLLVRAASAILGSTEWGLRLPFVVCGVITVPVTYALGRRLFNPAAGLAAAALLALSPYHITYSQEARHYALFLLYSVTALWLSLEALERQDARGGQRRSLWAGAILCHALNLLTHVFAFYPLVLCGVIWLSRGASLMRFKRGAPIWSHLAGAVLLAVSMAAAARMFRLERGGLTLWESYRAWFHPQANAVADAFIAFSGGEGPAWLLGVLMTAGTILLWRERRRSLADLTIWIGIPIDVPPTI